ncbi:hypothetical protein [Halomicrococcus sp. SG-WS-1]
MDPFERNVGGYYDVEDGPPTYLRSMAERQFAAAERERARRATSPSTTA